MSGESSLAKAEVQRVFQDVEGRSDMDVDAMGRALVQAVIEHYLSYRDIGDVRRELEYLVESLDDDDPVVTRGC